MHALFPYAITPRYAAASAHYSGRCSTHTHTLPRTEVREHAEGLRHHRSHPASELSTIQCHRVHFKITPRKKEGRFFMLK
jgi:hypothetical protein